MSQCKELVHGEGGRMLSYLQHLTLAADTMDRREAAAMCKAAHPLVAVRPVLVHRRCVAHLMIEGDYA